MTMHSSPAIVQLKCVWQAGITYNFTECFELKVICGDILKQMGVEQQEEFTHKTTCYFCNPEDHNLNTWKF